MATLNDLKITPLSKLTESEGLELILEMRLRRRNVPERAKRTKVRKEIPPESVVDNLSEKQLADLYYTLMAKRQENLL